MKNPLVIADRIADHINPIMVKELRQAVRSRYVASILLLFLLVCFSALTVVVFVAADNDFSLGRHLFMGLCVTLFGAGLVFVPLYAGLRLAIERTDTQVDLFFVTTIKPRQIISGKTFSGWAILLLLYSVCAPFLLFSYLLRGVGIPTILLTLLMQFVVCLFGLQFGIFVACIPASRPVRALLGLAGTGALVFVVFGWVEMLQHVIFYGGFTLGMHDFWPILGSQAGIALAAMVFFFLAAVGMLTPAMANRTWRLRVYFTILWPLTLGLTLYLYNKYSAPQILLAWYVVCTIVLCCMLLVSVSEKDAWTRRMRRAVPLNPLLRVPFVLFYSTSLGGLVWNALLAAATLGAALIFKDVWTPAHAHRFTDMDKFIWMWSVLWLYTLGYGLFGWYVRRRLPPRWAKSAPAFVLASFLATLLGSVPAIVYITLQMQRVVKTAYEQSMWQLGNPFMVLQAPEQLLPHHACLAGLCTLVFLALLSPNLRQQVRDCRPLSQ